MRIEGSKGKQFIVHDHPGFTVQRKKAIMQFFPSVEKEETGFLKLHSGEQDYFTPRIIKGEVTVEIHQPSFKLF